MDVRFFPSSSLVALVLLFTACTGSSPPAARAPEPASTAPSSAAAASGAAAPSAPAAPPAAAPRLETVRLPTGNASINQAAVYLGIERGYWREEGIELDLADLGTGTSSQVLPPLAAGQIDVAVGGTAAGLYNAIAQGVTVRIALDMTTAYPGDEAAGILVRKELVDSGRLREPADLRGLRLGFTTKGHSTEMLLDKALGWGGLTFQDVEPVEIPYPEMNVALANNNLDAAASIEPFAAVAVHGGYAVRWKSWADVLPYDQVGVIMFAPEFADGRNEVAKRYAKVWVRGTREFEAARTRGVNREDIIAILQKHTILKDRAMYDYMPWPSFNPDGRVNAESIAAAQDWFASHGYVPRPVDLTKVIDHQFADYAVAQLGPYRP
jgi:NitT/TauT family transport system substrate-binding protein